MTLFFACENSFIIDSDESIESDCSKFFKVSLKISELVKLNENSIEEHVLNSETNGRVKINKYMVYEIDLIGFMIP